MAGILLVISGADGPGHGGQVHPPPGRHRLHQRHRGAHRQHADQGLLRPANRARAGRFCGTDGGACDATSARISLPPPLLAVGGARRDHSVHPVSQARSGLHRGPVARHGVVAALHLPVETIGTRFGGIPSGLPRFRVPEFRADMILPLLSPALTVRCWGPSSR